MPRPLSDHQLALIRNSMGESIPVPPKPRRSQRNEESRIQQDVIAWWALAYRGLGVACEELLYAIPNGHRRDPVTGAILKREGLRSGASDLALAVARGPYHGLYLELKTETGRPSPAQCEFLDAVIAEGYRGRFAYGFDAAKAEIEGYLSLKP